MRNNTYSYKGKKIPIARIDTWLKHNFLEKEGLVFEDLPKLLIYYEGQPFRARENVRMID